MKKLLELLNNNKLDELRIELTKRLLTQNHKSPNLIKSIQSYFKKTPKERPILSTIQHDTNNNQFICDGFSLYYFKQHHDELDALPQSTQDTGSINPKSIIDTINPTQPITDDIYHSITNIKNYINFAKSQPTYNKKELLTMTLGNSVSFQTYILEQLHDILKATDTLYPNLLAELTPNGLKITNDALKILILPVRTTKQDFTKEFLNME